LDKITDPYERTLKHKKYFKKDSLKQVKTQLKVAKWMEMQALVLFNLLYDNQDELYAAPVVFRTGFRINP